MGISFFLHLIPSAYSKQKTVCDIFDISKYLNLQVLVVLPYLHHMSCCILPPLNWTLNTQLQKTSFDGLFNLIARSPWLYPNIICLICLSPNHQGSVNFSNVQMICFITHATSYVLSTNILFGGNQTQAFPSARVFSLTLFTVASKLL